MMRLKADVAMNFKLTKVEKTSETRNVVWRMEGGGSTGLLTTWIAPRLCVRLRTAAATFPRWVLTIASRDVRHQHLGHKVDAGTEVETKTLANVDAQRLAIQRAVLKLQRRRKGVVAAQLVQGRLLGQDADRGSPADLRGRVRGCAG